MCTENKLNAAVDTFPTRLVKAQMEKAKMDRRG